MKHRFAIAALLVCACGPGGDNNGPGTNNGPANNGPANNGTTPPKWSTAVVDSNNVGMHTRLAISGSTLGVAYYSASGTPDGLCEVASDNKPERVIWGLWYAENGGGSWAVEKVSDLLHVGPPVGIDLLMDDATPRLAAMTGEPLLAAIPFYCGVNDAGLWTRTAPGAWSDESVVASSSEASTGFAPSDFGEVVGYWSSVAKSSSGQYALAYKDVHAGSIQSDDMRRADLELALGTPGSWENIPVHYGEGAGDFIRVAFDAQDRIYIAYFRPTESRTDPAIGIWLTRSADAGATWEEVQLFNSGTSEGPDLVFDPATGAPMVLFYNSTRGFPQLAELTDDAQFTSVSEGWTFSDAGDSSYDEGYRTSLAVSPNGTVAAAYYRCTKASGTFGVCNATDDALVFAYRDRGTWVHEVVDPGGDGLCGFYASLVFDASGIAHVAYQCEDVASGLIQNQVRVATRATAL